VSVIISLFCSTCERCHSPTPGSMRKRETSIFHTAMLARAMSSLKDDLGVDCDAKGLAVAVPTGLLTASSYSP
jgi:hypothetical protein